MFNGSVAINSNFSANRMKSDGERVSEAGTRVGILSCGAKLDITRQRSVWINIPNTAHQNVRGMTPLFIEAGFF